MEQEMEQEMGQDPAIVDIIAILILVMGLQTKGGVERIKVIVFHVDQQRIGVVGMIIMQSQQLKHGFVVGILAMTLTPIVKVIIVILYKIFAHLIVMGKFVITDSKTFILSFK